MTDQKNIEKNALITGAFINFIMALSGWLAYYLSNSQALLLDGNYSFIICLTTLVAVKITKFRNDKTELFPFGKFVFESLYSLLKGVMIVGIIIVAFIDNTAKIIHFINGRETDLLNTQVILIYSVFMTFLCFGLAFYYKAKNKKLGDTSTILRAEHSASIIDGFMSAGIGVALGSLSFIDPESSFGFMLYIGDAVLVILLCMLFTKDPLLLIRDSFIELAGGTLQNNKQRDHIITVLQNYLGTGQSYISKTGSSYLVVAYIQPDFIQQTGTEKLQRLKSQIMTELEANYPNVTLELVLN